MDTPHTADPLADDPLAEPSPEAPPAAPAEVAEAPEFGGERDDDALPEPVEPPEQAPEPQPVGDPAPQEPPAPEPVEPPVVDDVTAPDPQPVEPEAAVAPPAPAEGAQSTAPDGEEAKDKERPYTVLEGLPLADLVATKFKDAGITITEDQVAALEGHPTVFFELGDDVIARNPTGALRGLFKRVQEAGKTEIDKYLAIFPRSAFQPKRRRIKVEQTVSID